MNLKESAEFQAFRKEVRTWVMANMPPPPKAERQYFGFEDGESNHDGWFRKLAAKGWLAYRWPEEYGGPGFTDAQKWVFLDEVKQCDAPAPQGFGLNMVGPLIYQFGTPAQKERFLPAIARHETIWCQGYSEPNAGSDLAALQTSAVLDGDHFVVNGQKTWGSRVSAADWMFVLVRTDNSNPKRQQGISFLLVDMKSPGVSIKPIPQIDGRAGFFETFFDNVRVPKDLIVGKINEGWSMAKALLEHERISTGADHDPLLIIEKVKRLAQEYHLQNGRASHANDSTNGNSDRSHAGAFRQKLAALEMDANCLRYARYRVASRVMQGLAPGPEASIFKLYNSELNQRIYDLALEAMGPNAATWYNPQLSEDAYAVPMEMIITRAMSIYSGSNEVQRNIIAKRVLQLPD